MLRFLFLFLTVSFTFLSCSEPLDAEKIEVHKFLLDSESKDSIEIVVPKGAVEFPGAQPEDMLGLYTIYSKKVRLEDFAIEVEFITLSGVEQDDIVQEKLEEIKIESESFRLIKQQSDGFFFESKEINGDLNYSFIKIIVAKTKYAVVFPEPKPDGNTSMEEAKFMYDIINKQI
tara:strand:+ start:292 stop:813 length:522 start_codon:yes stop_codon:yes gene_type:complete